MLRTDFLDPNPARNGDIPVADYAQAATEFESYIAGANHQHANDPADLAAHIVTLVSGSTVPARFLFGADTQDRVAQKLVRLQADLEQSAALAAAAD